MSATPNNPPLFDLVDDMCNRTPGTEITLRDLFAAFALAGYRSVADANETSLIESEVIGIWSYQDADSMLEARETKR